MVAVLIPKRICTSEEKIKHAEVFASINTAVKDVKSLFPNSCSV